MDPSYAISSPPLPIRNFLHRHEGPFTYRPRAPEVPKHIPQSEMRNPHRYCLTSSITDLFLKNALLFQANLPNFTLENRQVVQLSEVAIGQHCLVLQLLSEQPQVMPNVPNEKILFKTFSDYSITVQNDPQSKIHSGAELNVLRQYEEMTRANIPVMKIYNGDQVQRGCGYFIVEKVATPFWSETSGIPPWAKGTPIAHLRPEQKSLLDEVKGLFEHTFTQQIHADIRPDNLRRREDGTLVFVDLRENRPDPEDFASELKFDFMKMPENFHCEMGDEIYRYLLPSTLAEEPGTTTQ